jgi:hypothetical protein
MMWGTERMLGRDTLNDDRRMANSSTMGFMKASESGCVLLRANLEELRCALKNRVEVTFTRKAMIFDFRGLFTSCDIQTQHPSQLRAMR